MGWNRREERALKGEKSQDVIAGFNLGVWRARPGGRKVQMQVDWVMETWKFSSAVFILVKQKQGHQQKGKKKTHFPIGNWTYEEQERLITEQWIIIV